MINKEELKKSLYTSLKSLDLSDQEIELYLISLILGPSTIAKIAQHLKMARPNVYLLIRGLEKAGLVKFSQQKKFSRSFMVEPPTIILEKIRELKKNVNNSELDLVSVMPDLLAQYSQGQRETKIKVMQGKEAYVESFEMIMEEAKDTIELFGSLKDFIISDSWERQNVLTRKRINKKIHINALLLPSEDAELIKTKDKEQLRETRILKIESPFITSFQMFANKVIIWQPKAYVSLLIEDEFIVQMFRSMFYKLWEISK
jgi:sugar-specific transcriptional regulator TrmB